MTDDEDCVHEDIVDRPGANPVCPDCGEVNPDGTIPETPTMSRPTAALLEPDGTVVVDNSQTTANYSYPITD